MTSPRAAVRPSSRALFLLAAVLVAAPLPSAGQGLALDLVEQTTGLVRPTAVAHPADGSGRLFIAQLDGRVRILDGGTLAADPFLDLSPLVTCCGELGLVGLAFHPD